jgi:hypothetical protein
MANFAIGSRLKLCMTGGAGAGAVVDNLVTRYLGSHAHMVLRAEKTRR